MKILAISHSCAVAVNQRLFIELEAIPDVQVQLVAPANWQNEYSGEPFLPEAHPDATFPILFAPVVRPGHVWQHAYTKIPVDKIKAFGPDIVYSTQEPWSLSNWQFRRLARSLKIPYVFHTNQNLIKTLPPPFHQMEQAAYKDAALALAYSEEARQVMLQKGLKGQSAVAPYATNVTQFFPGKEQKRRDDWGLGQSIVVGYLGRFVSEKGLDLALEAVAPLIREGLDIRVCCVGTGGEQANLEAQAATLGITDRVHFPGGVAHDQAGAAMRCFDMLVLPSRTRPNWKEQFGRVLIEAWATGIPTIGSDSGEIPNLIRATGGGLIFREGDVAKFTEALRQLSIDAALRAKLGESGRKAVEEHYTFPAVAAQLVRLFHGVLRTP
ncbi:MAG: glycosyltransferase family 4 protein [Armatimonas sp.]